MLTHLSLVLSLAFALAFPATHAQTGERSGGQIVAAQCVECHGEGLNGAPKIGDREAWAQRIARNVGFDNLVLSAIRGYAGMPSRGDQANLTDSELRSAIQYMYHPAGAVAKPTLEVARPVGEGPFPSRWSGGGMNFYLGFMPAQNLLQLPEGSPERTMHGGVPSGVGYYHVNVSLFNEMTNAPINDAQIRIQLQQRGLTSIETKLEPMLNGVGSYGNFVKPQPETPYLIILNIARPGPTSDVEARFKHRFE
jgi:cytochrome c5